MSDCANTSCPSDNLFRAGRCQACYRYFRLHGTDQDLAPAAKARRWLRRHERELVRSIIRGNRVAAEESSGNVA